MRSKIVSCSIFLFFFILQISFTNIAFAQTKSIVVGVLENWPPQYVTDKKTKEQTGFAVDIIEAVGRLSGLDIKYQVFEEWPILNQALREKKIDVIPNMGIIEERENFFNYTMPVETTKILFFVRETSNDINSEKDLIGRTIGVVETNKGRFILEERGWDNLKIYHSFDEALMSLLSGISDGFLYPDPPFMTILKQYGLRDRVKVVGSPQLEVKRAIAVHKDNSDLINTLNDAVKVLMSSEEYKNIFSKWYGPQTPFWSVKLVAVIMGISIFIMGMVLLAWRYYSVMKLNQRLLIQTKKRSEAEKALIMSREDLLESQRIAHVGSWRLDIHTNQVVWSEELYKMYGFDPEFPPPPYTEHQKLFTPDSWKQLSTALNKTKDEGIPYELELETLREDGSNGWMWVRGETVLDENGIVIGLRGAAQDITERKLAEKNLIATELRYHALFENMTAGFVLFEVVQNDNGEPIDLIILAANKRFEATTGLKAQDVIGKPLSQVLPGIENDAAGWIETYGKIALYGGPLQFEQDSELLGYYFSIIAYQAGLNQCAVTFVDITERKKIEHEKDRLEAQLIQAQKMESIGTLAGGVAHDYNNMLSIIIGYAGMIMGQLEADDPIYKDVKEIYNAGKRSSKITRQLLAFARQQTIKPIVLDLNKNIENMLKMIRRLIGEDIDLAWLPASGLWPLKIDPGQIDQILANLCVNARDAIDGVGKITIETENISFDKEYCFHHPGFIPGDFLMLSVSDNGSGMAPETVDKIFEPFFTTKGLHQGTGLGLSTVYGIVKQNDGFINVYSELEEGTTIKSYFKRYTGNTAEAGHDDITELPLSRGETILLVEDDDSILKLGVRMLESLGYSVLPGSTPKKAMTLAADNKDEIDLLITDIVMPEMNGKELSEKLQTICPGLKTLYMSGYTANVIAHRGVLDEGISFLPKPLSKKELALKVRKMMDEKNGNSHA